MKLSEAIDVTRRHNAWRRDNSGAWEMLPPDLIGQALDTLCNYAEKLERELEQERQLADRLKNALEDIAFGTIIRRKAGGCGQSLICTPEQLQNHAAEALSDWRKSRNEAGDPP